MLVLNGNIHTMTDKDYKNGFIYIKDGKISSIGDMAELPGGLWDSNVINLSIL